MNEAFEKWWKAETTKSNPRFLPVGKIAAFCAWNAAAPKWLPISEAQRNGGNYIVASASGEVEESRYSDWSGGWECEFIPILFQHLPKPPAK